MNVRMNGVSQRFGKVQALDDVHFEAKTREITALVGENGAGKTTLMRVLYGALQADSADIELDGESVRLESSERAIAAGVGMVSQHYAILPELTCLQNLMLGAEPTWAIRRTAAEARATKLAETMGFEFDWRSKAATLGPAGAQKLEILKLLWRDASVMILDEPTAMLSPEDSDLLYASLRRLADEGRSVIVVTHRITEVLRHCDAVTVLRGGRWIQSDRTESFDAESLAEAIVGHPVSRSQVTQVHTGDVALRLRGVSAKGDRGELALRTADLELRAGEVVGVAGVDGNGQRELFEAILGVRPCEGEIELLGGPAPKRVADRLAAGVRLIAEDRHEESIVESWTLDWNASLGLQREDSMRRGGWIRDDARRAAAKRMAERFDTKHPGVDRPISALSGGNQQRFVAGRAVESDGKLLLAFAPSRGLDLDAGAKVYAAIRERCRGGMAALVVSFDLDELLQECDRVVAIYDGDISEPPQDLAKDRSAIGRLMLGKDAAA